MRPSRPTALEWALATFCVFAGLYTVVIPWDSELFWGGGWSPYRLYYGDIGVRLINASALTVDILIVAVVVGWRFSQPIALHAPMILMVLVAMGAVLAWTELWYGSTFYYGEVRDKQGLPFGVNNGGVVGSYAFIGYAAYRVVLAAVHRSAVFVVVPAQLTASWISHSAMLTLLEEPWKLWQS